MSTLMTAFLLALLLSSAMVADASESTRAPVCPDAPLCRIAKVQRAPDLHAEKPLSDPLWQSAQPAGPFFSKGQGEADERATDVRILSFDDTIFIRAACKDPRASIITPGRQDLLPGPDDKEFVVDDSLEFYFTQSPEPAFPYIKIRVNAAGHVAATRFLRPFSRWKVAIPSEPLDESKIRVRTGVADWGWWALLAVPAHEFAIPQTQFAANIVRHREADDSRFAWVDIKGRSIHYPYHFGRVIYADAPLESRPRLALPADLAVGANRLKFLDWREGYLLLANGTPIAVASDGAALVQVSERGRMSLEVVDSTGEPVCGYRADVPRPLIVNVTEPLHADLSKPLAVSLHLSVAGQGPVPVSVRAMQGEKIVGSARLDLTPGVHEVEIPCRGMTPGEVDVGATADVPASDDAPIAIEAAHWCLRGVDRSDVDRYRDGLDRLPTLSLYRAGLADACSYYRSIQGGDGRYRTLGRDGGLHFTEWNFGMVYAFALLYKTAWPENPHFGDKRFLASAAAGMEAGLDAGAAYVAGGYSRHLQAFLLTYELIKNDVEPETARYWRDRMIEILQHTLDTTVTPGKFLYSFYSTDIGTSTNHYSYYVANVLAAGRVLERPDWLELGKSLMLRLVAHERDGHFPERRGVPTTHYTWLTMNAVGQYYTQTGDESVVDCLKRCAEFSCHTILPTMDTILLFDGRNNHYYPYNFGEFALSFTPHGRFLADRRARINIAPNRRPSMNSPEFFFRTAENALYFRPGQKEPFPRDTELSLCDGMALIVRRNGFIYGLSAIPVPPVTETYRLDPQNTVELHHETIGPILHGANSIMQAEAGSFSRKVADSTIFLPTYGTVERISDGHIAFLKFDTFSAHLACSVLSQSRVRITVTLQDALGDEPVLYSFFPGVQAPDELTASPDAKSLRFGKVRIDSSRAVVIERDFKITNPYTLNRTTDTKPVRASVPLEKTRPVVLDITLAEK